MPDRSAENLERIRACDAGWNENDHPRANNGQFTSGGGGGVKVSKLPEGKTTAHNSIKAGQIAKNKEHYDKTHQKAAARYLSDLAEAVKKGDYESAHEALESHQSDKKYYDKLTAKNNKMAAAKATLEKARPGIAKMREGEKPGNAAEKTAKSKMTTRFDKDMAKADKSYEDFREVMQKRKSEIEVLRERLRTTKNSFVAQATKQELDRLVSEYNRLDEMY